MDCIDIVLKAMGLQYHLMDGIQSGVECCGNEVSLELYLKITGQYKRAYQGNLLYPEIYGYWI